MSGKSHKRHIDEQYIIILRIDWIRDRLARGIPFNSRDIVAEFDVAARTAYRDIRFCKLQYYGDRLKFDIPNRTFYLV